MLRTTTRTVIVTSEFHLINLFLSCLFVCVCMCFKLMYLGMINFSFYLFDDDEYFFSILKKRTHVFLDFFYQPNTVSDITKWLRLKAEDKEHNVPKRILCKLWCVRGR